MRPRGPTKTFSRRCPDCPDAIHLLGVLASQRGRPDIGINMIQRAITLKPQTPEFHFNLGGIYRTVGKMEESIAQTRRAVELKPDMPGGYANLGLALSETGQLDEAIEILGRAIKLEPKNAGAHLDLGNVYWKMAKHEQRLHVFAGRLDANRTIRHFTGAAQGSAAAWTTARRLGGI